MFVKCAHMNEGEGASFMRFSEYACLPAFQTSRVEARRSKIKHPSPLTGSPSCSDGGLVVSHGAILSVSTEGAVWGVRSSGGRKSLETSRVKGDGTLMLVESDDGDEDEDDEERDGEDGDEQVNENGEWRGRD